MTDEFVGTFILKTKHAAQLAEFEAWAARGNWSAYHHAHYDWWAYPIDSSSGGQGNLYNVTPEAIDELKADSEFMRLHRRGLQLGALAWGWDIDNARNLPEPATDQAWSHWPVRLNKMARSAKLFGHADYFRSLRTFAADLKAKGEPFEYAGWDLYKVFVA